MSTSESNREGAGKPSLYLTSYLVHTNVADISTIRFDSLNPAEHNILNDIKHITLYAQKSNYHSIPTDCPTVSKTHTHTDRILRQLLNLPAERTVFSLPTIALRGVVGVVAV